MAPSGKAPADARVDGLRFAVTGGCGFAGQAMVANLVARGAAHVRAVDVRGDDAFINGLGDRATFVRADVTNSDSLREAFGSVDCVIHMAAYFGFPAFSSKRYCDDPDKMRLINVGGARNVVEACTAEKVRALVFISTVNVVFVGEDLAGSDEAVPYPDEKDYVDFYGVTKAEAERFVLSSSGHQGLFTCALRPNGIIGPSASCMVINKAMSSLLDVGGNFFNMTVPTDVTHVENLAQAAVLAAQSLLEGGRSIAAGKAYNITDEEAIAYPPLLRPCIEACGMAWRPILPLPYAGMLFFARFSEACCWCLRRLPLSSTMRMAPMLTELEVKKTLRANFFSSTRARKELGYAPAKSADYMPALSAYCAKHFSMPPPVTKVPLPVWLMVVPAMCFVGYLAYGEPTHSRKHSLLMVRDILGVSFSGIQELSAREVQQVVHRQIWVPAMLAHTTEAVIAMIIASQNGGRVLGWGVQTFFLGIGSLRHLLKTKMEVAMVLSWVVGMFAFFSHFREAQGANPCTVV